MSSERVPISCFRPVDPGWRVGYLQLFNGTGLTPSMPYYEVRCACGEWTPARGKFCCHCSAEVTLSEELRREVYPPPPGAPPPPVPGSFSAGIIKHNPGKAGDLPSRGFNDDARVKAIARSELPEQT